MYQGCRSPDLAGFLASELREVFLPEILPLFSEIPTHLCFPYYDPCEFRMQNSQPGPNSPRGFGSLPVGYPPWRSRKRLTLPGPWLWTDRVDWQSPDVYQIGRPLHTHPPEF